MLFIVLCLAPPPGAGDEKRYEDGPVLTCALGENGLVMVKFTSSYRKDRKSAEVVITDTFGNFGPGARLSFSAPAEEGVIGKAAAPGTPRMVSFQANTYMPVVEDGANLTYRFDNGNQAIVTARFWGEKGADTRAAIGKPLFGRLIDGGRDGSVLVECRSEISEGPGKKYAYTYTIRNTSGQRLTVKWAGYEETLDAGAVFMKTVTGGSLTRETAGSAQVSLPDRTVFRFRANYWLSP